MGMLDDLFSGKLARKPEHTSELETNSPSNGKPIALRQTIILDRCITCGEEYLHPVATKPKTVYLNKVTGREFEIINGPYDLGVILPKEMVVINRTVPVCQKCWPDLKTY